MVALQDGIVLHNTENLDNILTWLFNLLFCFKDLHQAFEKSREKDIMLLSKLSKQFRNGNSAEVKKTWFKHCKNRKYTLDTSSITFKNTSDISVLPNRLEESAFGSFKMTSHFNRCSNKIC